MAWLCYFRLAVAVGCSLTSSVLDSIGLNFGLVGFNIPRVKFINTAFLGIGLLSMSGAFFAMRNLLKLANPFFQDNFIYTPRVQLWYDCFNNKLYNKNVCFSKQKFSRPNFWTFVTAKWTSARHFPSFISIVRASTTWVSNWIFREVTIKPFRCSIQRAILDQYESKVQSLKADLKQWEKSFELEFSRKPSSKDIKERPNIGKSIK